ncbi:pantetheinase-like [Ornithodoros turicata]|uniref:pantetheinase-like n=1 Tax=Ornithodoros turicata TaxID=34597 RepID=UPI003138F336
MAFLWLVSLCYLVVLFRFSYTFKAAVYEHVQQGDRWNDSATTIIRKNLLKYQEATRNASLQGSDIIVFPEVGILSVRNALDHAEDIPEPGNVNPCQSSAHSNLSWPILSNLSCLARDNKIYLVANVVDTKPCVHPNCSKSSNDTQVYYNTNVAFDRNGTLVSRYHKNHLFGERRFDEPNPPEFAVFETDFGAKVGMFICFDILFKEASQLVTKHEVDLAVTSAWWFDELPNWSSVAVQETWAIRHNVTLLVSGIQRPSSGSLGSGIYRGEQGPLIYTYSPDWEDKLLIADTDEPLAQNIRYRDDVLEVNDRVIMEESTMDYAAVKLEGTLGEETVCQGNYCCTVRFAVPSMNDSFFLLFKIGYKPTPVGIRLGVQECMVAVCEPEHGRPCGRFLYTSNTTFTRLEIRANFSVPDIYPVVLSDQLALTATRHWNYNVTTADEAVLAIEEGNPPPEPLLSAVLLGRIYDNDVIPPRARD